MTRGSAAPSVPGGWSSASFTGLSGTAASLVNETVYLYTNIQAPGTSRAFWKKCTTFGRSHAPTPSHSLAKGSSAYGQRSVSSDGQQ